MPENEKGRSETATQKNFDGTNSTTPLPRGEDLLGALQRACDEVGIEYRQVPADGRWHETQAGEGSNGRGDGRIKIFTDGEGGVICNWRTGVQQTFFARNDRDELTPAERAARDRKREEARRLAREEEAQRQTQAAARAGDLWTVAAAAPPDHPYLVKKAVKAHGARVHDGQLVVPMRDGDTLHSLQFIDGGGD